MKNFATVVVMVGLMAGSAQAANLLEGNRELGVSGMIDFDTLDDTLIDLDFGYGFFVADLLELGGRVGITDSDSFSQWRLGGFTEYHFYMDQPLVPFIGLSIDLAGAEVTKAGTSTDSTGLVLGAAAGVKYFLNEEVAISTALNFQFGSDDVFPSDKGLDSTNWDIEVGLRFYF